MISDEKLTKALTYLAETDESCAKARSLLAGLEYQIKTIFGVEFLHASGETVKEREAQSHASQAYRDHVEKIQNATYDYEAIRNRRLTAELIVEVWRTTSANRRKGNI